MRITTARLTGALCVALLAAGCGGATVASTSHTATAQSTPRTAHTATQTPVKLSQRVLTAEQITTAIQAQGFEPKAKVTAYTAATDPNQELGRQFGYTSKTAWHEADGSVDAIEVYPTTAGATERAAILGSVSSGLIGDGYDYQQGPVILRLSKALTPLQAGLAYSDMLNVLDVKGT